MNTEWPEDNREFFIYPSHEIKCVAEVPEMEQKLKVGAEMNGYYVALAVDPRHGWDNQTIKMFEAVVHLDEDDNTNEVHLTVPAWMCGLTFISPKDRSSWEDKVEEALLAAIDNGANNFIKGVGVPKKYRLFKRFRLVFPEGHKLSSKAVNAKGCAGEAIPGKMISIKTKHANFGAHSVLKHFVIWKVARLDKAAFSRGPVAESPKNKGANDDLMGDIGDDFADMSTDE